GSKNSPNILQEPARRVQLNGRHYTRLNVLGKGGSSCVWRIIGNECGRVYAYKRVDVRDGDDVDAVFDSYANEINLLRRLNGSDGSGGSVDFEVCREQRYIAMLLEAGDVDLAKSQVQSQAQMDPFFARMAWREMLEAVQHIHTHRIVHGDLKPANFVFVRGHLKLIDFGIAKSFTSDTTNIYRESQIGTINYMAPEAIAPMSQEECDEHGDQERLKMRLGRASDIWSLGCILYQIVFGRPPFAALNTIQKLATIPSPKHVIRYPDWGEAAAVDAMRACLVHDPRARRGIAGPEGLLLMPYLQLMSSPSPSVSAATATAATAAE
ncbi:kinase-like domain-containing protein, partial [Ochromonadaceae sp. CCMP2298]